MGDKLLVLVSSKDGTRIAIPLSQIKEISETDTEDTVKVNGHLVDIKFEELLLSMSEYMDIDYKDKAKGT